MDNFFTTVELISQKDPRPSMPIYIHRSRGAKTKVYFTTELARKDFEECPYRFHIMQRYIRVGSRSVWKVSVDWQEGCTKYFTLTNDLPFDCSKEGLLNRRKKDNAKVFESAVENDMEKFLVKFENTKSYHIVATLKPILGLSNIVKQLIPVLNLLIFKNREISEIVLDFIKESRDFWVFIGVKGFMLKGEQTKRLKEKKKLISISTNFSMYPVISLTQAKTPSSSEELPAPQKRIEHKKITRVTRKIHRQATNVSMINIEKSKVHMPSREEQYSFYLNQKKSDSYGRIPFNMIGIVPQKMGTHLTSFIETKRELLPKPIESPEPPLGLYLTDEISVKSNITYLQEISENLDNKLSLAAQMKKKRMWDQKIKAIAETIGSSLENIFRLFLHSLKEKPIIGGNFDDTLSDPEIYKICRSYMKMLKGTITKNQIKKQHKHLKIKPEEFPYFIQRLQEVLLENFVPDSEMIIESFDAHKDEIISNS